MKIARTATTIGILVKTIVLKLWFVVAVLLLSHCLHTLLDASYPAQGQSRTSGRAVSITVQLSDPSEYDGGELEVASLNASKEVGTVALFPSYMVHKVHRVRKGTRRSVVAWFQLADPQTTFADYW
jgi:predicted 2-oxoglutarate/Fe(II)-dependent dioxygenase YbiX